MPPGVLVTAPGPCFVTVSAYDAAVIVNDRALDTDPSGFATVTCAVPAAAMSAAAIVAVSCPALTNVVVRALPFHRTLAPLTKFEPVTVSVNPAPPACAELGDKVASVGPGAAVMVNDSALDTDPSGFATVTCAVPAAAMSAAAIVAVSCPA